MWDLLLRWQEIEGKAPLVQWSGSGGVWGLLLRWQEAEGKVPFLAFSVPFRPHALSHSVSFYNLPGIPCSLPLHLIISLLSYFADGFWPGITRLSPKEQEAAHLASLILWWNWRNAATTVTWLSPLRKTKGKMDRKFFWCVPTLFVISFLRTV